MLTFFIYSLLIILLEQTQESLSQTQCPSLNVRRYVEYSCTSGRNANSRCTFSCTFGYRLRSRSARLRLCRCYSSFCLWTGPIATCLPSTSTAATAPSATTSSFLTSGFDLPNGCPQTDMEQHSFQAVDTWPTGGVFRIDINKNGSRVENGWSAVVKFTRNLPKNVTIMSWNSEVVLAKNRYLGLSSMSHNPNLTGKDLFSFTVIILGTTTEQMNNYEASVGFYHQKVKNASCFTMASDMGGQISVGSAILSANSSKIAGRITDQSQSSTSITNITTQAPSVITQSSAVTTQIPTTAIQSIKPSTQPPPPIHPQSNKNLNVDSVRIDNNAVRRHRGRCNVLLNALRVENPSYPAPGQSNVFRFNANVQIFGESNRMNDWTLKIIFSKRIVNVQLWSAVFERKSSDGRVYIFRPRRWNANLARDFEFQIIPEMHSRSIPQAVMYLCPSGVRPDFRHDGIFERVRTTATRAITRPTTRSTLRPTQRPAPPRPPPRSTATSRAQNFARCRSPAGRLPSRYGRTQVRYTPSPRNERRTYDYNQVIAMSILFYEAQRSGKLPSNNRIPWRGDSGLRDGCDVGRDLTGGWYDATWSSGIARSFKSDHANSIVAASQLPMAFGWLETQRAQAPFPATSISLRNFTGDHVKFGFPMAWSATTLAWGAIEFRDAYLDAGELRNVLNSLKWATDYFIKAHTAKYELYGQVGNGKTDHKQWGRPEEMRIPRPSYKITQSDPGSDLAAETAAALAASSIVFRDVDRRYADHLVRHAKELYEFADKYRKSYHESIPDAANFYRSYSGYHDELVWGALWLYRATNQRSYLNDAIRKYRLYGIGGRARVFSWDDKRAGCQVLMANLTGESQYRNHVLAYQRFLRAAPRTPRGLTWLDKWGSNRYAANGAFIALAASKVTGMRASDKSTLRRYAQSQIHYMLGGAGRSYVVGYGRNPPKRPHHRASSCPAPPSSCHWGNAFHSNRNNPNILYGALVAGPYLNGTYTDDRKDYVTNEVAVDYNAGFQGAVAGLKYYQIQARRN